MKASILLSVACTLYQVCAQNNATTSSFRSKSLAPSTSDQIQTLSTSDPGSIGATERSNSTLPSLSADASAHTSASSTSINHSRGSDSTAPKATSETRPTASQSTDGDSSTWSQNTTSSEISSSTLSSNIANTMNATVSSDQNDQNAAGAATSKSRSQSIDVSPSGTRAPASSRGSVTSQSSSSPNGTSTTETSLSSAKSESSSLASTSTIMSSSDTSSMESSSDDSTSSATPAAARTLAPSVVASINGSDVVIGSVTLTPGETFTSDSVTLSLASSGILRVGDSTTSLRPDPTEEPTGPVSTESLESSASITSTMTTIPTSVSLESRTDITANTSITTSEKDSQSSTIVPAVWCPGCGASGLAVVIWHFPPTPNLKIDWPDLPKIEFPCIPLPFKPCSQPPQTDDDKTDEDNDDDDDEEEDEQSTTASRTSTNDESSTTSPSSAESCSAGTTTATDCAVACSAFATSVAGSETSTTQCYTTKCVETTGCSVEATTSTSITYVVSSTEGPSCAFSIATAYNAKASYEAMGLSVPSWLQEPITHILPTSFDPSTTSSDTPTSATSKTDATTTQSSTTESSTTKSDKNAGDGDSTQSSMSGGSTQSTQEEATSTHDRSSDSMRSSTLAPSSNSTSSSHKSATLTSSSESTKSETSSINSSSTSSNSTRSATSSTRSSSSSSSSATPTYSVQEAVCNDESDFPDHGAVQPDLFRDKSADFCVNNLETKILPDSDSILDKSDEGGVSYEYKVEWIEDCEANSDEQSVKAPTGTSDNTKDCYSIFDKAFACNNGGVGGHVDVGCLRYTFTGAEFTTDQSPDDPDSSTDADEPTSPEEPEPESTPVDLEPKNLQCHDLNDYKRVTDVGSKKMRQLADLACKDRAYFMKAFSTPSVVVAWETYTHGVFEEKHDNYLYTFEWIKGCQGDMQNSLFPAGQDSEYTCQAMYERTYDDCAGNEGIGGSIDVGCLRYTFHGGVDDSTGREIGARGQQEHGTAIS